jgi:hypothetical protein
MIKQNKNHSEIEIERYKLKKNSRHIQVWPLNHIYSKIKLSQIKINQVTKFSSSC